jgi:pimeloyl-ACP methyl ester carboxylesterase
VRTEQDPSEPASQLTRHHADPVELAGPYGVIAGLRGRARGARLATALLVPGYTGSKEDFAPLLDPIAEAGIEVIAIDLPGQYESPGPDDEGGYTPGALGGVVAECVGKLSAESGSVLLLGHSFGGLVARAAVLASAPVRGLTLLDSGPSEIPAGPRREALGVGEPVLRTRGLAAAYEVRDELRGGDRPPMSPELRDFLRTRFLRSTSAGLLGMADGLRYEPDLVPMLATQLHALSMPCLVACGENDDAWSPAIQRDMAERLDADFAVIENSGHSPNTENPAGLLATLLPTWRAWLAG